MPKIPLTGPDERGRYGSYGGRFVPETLMGPLEELEEAYGRGQDQRFTRSWTVCCGPTRQATPLTPARRIASHIGKGASI
jgi:tryptophan synthase beta chain